MVEGCRRFKTPPPRNPFPHPSAVCVRSSIKNQQSAIPGGVSLNSELHKALSPEEPAFLPAERCPIAQSAVAGDPSLRLKNGYAQDDAIGQRRRHQIPILIDLRCAYAPTSPINDQQFQ